MTRQLKGLFVVPLVLAFGVAAGQGRSPNVASSPEDEKEPLPQQAGEQEAGIPQQHFEVTVTATRTPTSLQQLGRPVTIITADELEMRGAQTLQQALDGIPGFSVARTGSYGGATSVFVRGGESDFNLVLVDGVPVNQAGGAFDFADLSTANVERIEIVRGPASVLYGADAVTSTINIITRQGEGIPQGRFNIEGGTFDSYLFRGDIHGGSERVHYSLAGHYSQTDGFHDFNNAYDRTDVAVNFGFDLNASSSVSANFRYLDSRFGTPTDFTGAPVDPNDFRTTEETHYSVSFRNQFSNRYETRLQYGYHRKDFQNFNLEDGITDFFESTFQSVESRNYLDWQNDIQLDGRNLLTAGISLKLEETEIQDPLGRRSVGFYLQEQFSAAQRLFLTAGVRFDQNNRFQDFITATLSAGYLLRPDLKIRGSLGNGFRAPSFAEITGIPEFGILGSEKLRPEKNMAADFGVDFVRKAAGVSATVFFNRFSDLIEFSFLVPPGTPNYLNVEAAESQGLELEGSFQVNRVRLGGQYTLVDTEVTDAGTVPGGNFERGEPLLRRPKHSAGLYAEYLLSRLKLRFDIKFKGKRDDIQFFPDFTGSRVVLPSYWKADFRLTLPLFRLSDSRGDVAALFRGENLFDRKYTEIAGFESPGRLLMAGLQLSF